MLAGKLKKLFLLSVKFVNADKLPRSLGIAPSWRLQSPRSNLLKQCKPDKEGMKKPRNLDLLLGKMGARLVNSRTFVVLYIHEKIIL